MKGELPGAQGVKCMKTVDLMLGFKSCDINYLRVNKINKARGGRTRVGWGARGVGEAAVQCEGGERGRGGGMKA